MLTPIGKPADPPPVAPACGPPVRDEGLDSLPYRDAMAVPKHAYVFNREVHW
jgi:hypothetical protein